MYASWSQVESSVQIRFSHVIISLSRRAHNIDCVIKLLNPWRTVFSKSFEVYKYRVDVCVTFSLSGRTAVVESLVNFPAFLSFRRSANHSRAIDGFSNVRLRIIVIDAAQVSQCNAFVKTR